jgi:hypothetical protein
MRLSYKAGEPKNERNKLRAGLLKAFEHKLVYKNEAAAVASNAPDDTGNAPPPMIMGVCPPTDLNKLQTVSAARVAMFLAWRQKEEVSLA